MKNRIERLAGRVCRGSVIAGLLLLPLAAQADETPAFKERLQLCSGCHGVDGNTDTVDFPKLAGLSKEYNAKQLRDFKSGERASEVMSPIMQGVDESEFGALAGYFSEQTRGPGTTDKPELAAQGEQIYQQGIIGSAVPACAGCHNGDGSGSEKYPRLNGQNPGYVRTQLMNFSSGARKNDSKAVMQTIAKKLKEQEIAALAEYVTTLKEEAGGW